MAEVRLPPWAQSMKEIFRAETISQFILSGAIHDLVPFASADKLEFLPLKRYLAEVLFDPFDVVVFYNRGQGITFPKGGEHFFAFLQVFDKWHGSSFAADAGVARDAAKSLESPGLLPRAPGPALELIDRFLGSVAAVARGGKKGAARSVAVVLDFAQFVAPRGESLYVSSEIGSNIIKILRWSDDPTIKAANVATVLLAESLTDLHEALVENPYSAKVFIPLPDRAELQEYVTELVRTEPEFAALSEAPVGVLAEKLVGLSRVNVKGLVLRAVRNKAPITLKYLTRVKKELIEKEAAGRLEFIESKRTLDDVAGHVEAKKWLREDARLMKQGIAQALPMGYLITGRIGTGKTYLVECFAGECGIPFVALKNFREKWVGATEGNLEKIFQILHALGQVVVFVDEADQMTGKRGGGDSDSGLSGRVYGMLAAEMANTENRGRILWIFATSRPDLVEVDLKRQGRLDVHIPLFPPVDEAEKRELFLAMARKLKTGLKAEELPPLPFAGPVSGNELEGLLVRAYRQYMLLTAGEPAGEGPPAPAAAGDGPGGFPLGTGTAASAIPPTPGDPAAPPKTLAQILAETVREFRPSAHTARLELMDLLAVKECTDERFLPERFRTLDPAAVDRRLEELLRLIPS